MDSIDRLNNMTPYSPTKNITANSGVSNLINQLNKEAPNAFSNQLASRMQETLTGEIIDLKSGEIVVRLNDGTNISAKIYDTTSLSIGQTIRFHLQNSKGVLILEPVIDHSTSSDLVTKALESAHIPVNDKNIEIVNELLKHNMSLDSKSINTIIQQANINKNISVDTLVLMNKHNIPVTEDNATEISKYQNYEHRLIKEISNIATEVPKLLNSLTKSSNVETLVAINNKLVNILTSNKSTYLTNAAMNEANTQANTQANATVVSSINNIEIQSNINASNIASNSHITNAANIVDSNNINNGSTAGINTPTENFTSFSPSQLGTTEPSSYPTTNLPGVTHIKHDFPLLNNSINRLASPSMLSGDVSPSANITYTSTYNANPDVASAYLKPSSAHDLTTILEPYNIPEDILHGIKDGTASLRIVADEIRKAMEIADEIDDYRVSDFHASQRNPGSTVFGTVSPQVAREMGVLDSTSSANTLNTYNNSLEVANQSSNVVNLSLAKDAFEHPVVQNILDKYDVLQRDNSEVASFQNFYNRGQLTSKLRDIPNTAELSDRIWKGNISANDLLVEIKNVLEDSEPRNIVKILSSDQYQAVMKEAILNNWTISPNSLKQKDIVKDTYDNMYKQLNELQSLVSKLPLDKSIAESLTKELAGTKSNINFMNTINNLFSYVQLPLKLRDQNVHSDLYVMTNKKKLQTDKSNLNVLLHLDMEYLGSMDINIGLSGNVVNSKFHVSDEYTHELLSKNMEQLEYALLEKGFLFNSSVDLKEKDVNLVNDFLSSDTPSTSIKRYTFDMRG